MVKLLTTQILPEEMEVLFQALDLWRKIDDGRLTSDPIPKSRVPSWHYSPGISEIVRHRNNAGFHIATTHRVVMLDGSIPHWDAKDIHIGEITLYRIGH
jgi:hypothetical protein